MGSSGAKAPLLPSQFDALELSVRRLLDAHDALQRRAAAAETRVAELEAALGQVSAGDLDPLALAERARQLEDEKRALTARLAQAHGIVERIAARLNYLEADR